MGEIYEKYLTLNFQIQGTQYIIFKDKVSKSMTVVISDNWQTLCTMQENGWIDILKLHMKGLGVMQANIGWNEILEKYIW